MEKGFPNRKANALNHHWKVLKKEIVTVSPLPEAVRGNVAGNFWTTEQSITLIDVVKSVKDRRTPAHGEFIGFWVAVESAWEEGRIMKGWPNRTATGLRLQWGNLKKEIATVTFLPEAVCVMLRGILPLLILIWSRTSTASASCMNE